ncbi:MAG: choice-of-anchor D domain-containing protein, partial [Candidatus Binataceae bacterium]
APNPMAFAQALNNSQAENLTITNTSTAESPVPLYISSLALSDPVDFGIAENGCPMYPESLGAGARCNVAVNFAPQSAGTINGTLSISDNTTNSQPETVALNGTTSACPIGDRLGPTPPLVTPRLFSAGENTQLTVSSVVPPDPNLIPGSITLLQVDSNGNQIANLGQMYDDGTHGDVQAGDGNYTAQPTVNLPPPSQGLNYRIYFAVQASYSVPPGCRQSNNNERQILVSKPPPTQAEMDAYSNAISAGGRFYESEIANGVSKTQAAQDLVRYLITSFPGVVVDARYDPSISPNAVGVTFSNGGHGGILLGPSNDL